MKRLRFFAIIFILIISILTSASLPEKAFASFETAKNYVLENFSPAQATFQNNYNAVQKARYTYELNILRTIFFDKTAELQRTNPDLDDAPFQIRVLNDFITHLEVPLPSPVNSDLDKVRTDMLALSRALHTDISNGRLTQASLISASADAGAVESISQVQNSSASNLSSVRTNGSTKVETCSFTNVGACISAAVSWVINNTLLELAGFLVWLTANMFNYAIQIGILDFAKWAPESLYPIWLIIRQIVSLFIVFVGLYLGFMYILGRDEKFQKYIPWVIVFALFVNFSYPLARTAVDVSNIISLNVYTSAVGNNALTAGITSPDTAGALIMNRLGLQGLVMSATGEGTGGKVGSLTSINTISGSLLAVAFVLYAAYIFLLATGIMVMRTAALIFLIIASPILFVDSVLPILGEKAQLIRKIFFEQLAVGPVFMVMLALTLKFLEIFTTSGMLSSGGLSGASGGEQTIKTFFNIAMMLVMLHIMITVTKKTSGTIGEYATNAMGKVGGFGLGVATGGAGFLARGTLGRAAAAARDSKWVTNNQDSFIGRRAFSLSNSVANNTFDARNSSVVAGGMKKAGLDSGLLGMGGMSSGAKMGYTESSKKRFDDRRKEALEKTDRIKTRYERDVTDKNGNVLHRKGEVDTDSEAAKNRFIAASGGGAMFLTKEQKQKLKDELGAKEDKEVAQNIKVVKANSEPDLKAYKNIKDETLPDGTKVSAEEGRKKFTEQLRKELETVKTTDTELRGNQAQSLTQSIQAIEKINNQRKEQMEEVIKTEKSAVSTSVDIDLTQKSPQTIREEKQKIAAEVATNEMKMNDPNRSEGGNTSQAPGSGISPTKPSPGGAPTGFLALAKKERELRAARMAAQKSPEQIRDEKQGVAAEAAGKEMKTSTSNPANETPFTQAA